MALLGKLLMILLFVVCYLLTRDSLDLTSASRAYLMEPHWNPSVEQQALARVYRIGQQRPVTTVRYIMRNSYKQVHTHIVPNLDRLR